MKKFIKKYLKKHLNSSHPKHYYFLRWLASIVESDHDSKAVHYSIGAWMFYGKHKLPFHDIFLVDNQVYILTECPGLWIGKSGIIIDECKNFINTDTKGNVIHDYHINLIENHNDAICNVYSYISSIADY